MKLTRIQIELLTETFVQDDGTRRKGPQTLDVPRITISSLTKKGAITVKPAGGFRRYSVTLTGDGWRALVDARG